MLVWAATDADWQQNKCAKEKKFCLTFSPSYYKGLEFTLCLRRALGFLMIQLHPLLPERAELWLKAQPKEEEKKKKQNPPKPPNI